MTYRVGRRQVSLFVPYIAAAILSATLLAIGTNVDWRLIVPIGARTIARACTQLGSLGLLVTAVLLLLCLRSADAPKKVLIRSAQAMGFVLMILAIGEVLLRLIYSDGMSFMQPHRPYCQGV